MKILFLTRRYYPEVGGVEKHCYEVASRLVKMGHEVSIVCEKPLKNRQAKEIDYQLVSKSDNRNIKKKEPVKSIQTAYFTPGVIGIIRLNFGNEDWFKKLRIWYGMLNKFKLLENADVIVCHDVFFWYLPFRFFFPKKRVITIFHGYESFPVRKGAVLIRKISEILSSGTICVGDFMKKWYRAKPDYVTYGGVDKRLIRNSKLEILNSWKTPSALFIGRLDEQTGILEYSEAVSKIKLKFPGFKFTIAGDGKFKNKVKSFGKVLGFVKDPEKLLPAHQYAFVSRYLAILEALASKRMVFALYDNPLKEDYLKKSPFARFISISRDPEALVRDILYYRTHPSFERKKVEAGYVWVEKQTWEKVISLYEKLWKK